MPEFLSSAVARFIAASVALLGVAAAIAWGVHAIDQKGYQRAQTECDAQVKTLQNQQQSEARRAELEQQAKVEEQSRNLLRLSETLIAKQTEIDSLKNQLKERAHDVSTQYRSTPAAPLQPVPDWIVTHGWVCDYNRAIGYTTGDQLLGTAAAAGRDAAAACAADAFAPSSITAEQILGHHEDYGAYCRKLEQQVNALLDAYEAMERQVDKK